MNYATIRQNDLTVVLSIYPAASTEPEGTEEGATPRLFAAAGPALAAKDRGEVLALLPKIAAILKSLHKAHLDGKLDAGDLQAMQQLEVWYSQLLAEKERAAPAAPREPDQE